MPLDKIQDVEKYIQTHKSLILHIKGNPVACVVEEIFENKSKYDLTEKKSEIKASLSGFLNKHEEIGLLMGFKLRIQVSDQILEYTSYPTDEFIDTVIFNEKIFLIDEKMNQIVSFKQSALPSPLSLHLPPPPPPPPSLHQQHTLSSILPGLRGQ